MYNIYETNNIYPELSFNIYTIFFALFSLIGLWKIFNKAGRSGILSIIPIVNMVVLFKIIGVSLWWFVIIFLLGCFTVFFPILIIPLLILAIYVSFLQAFNFARAFGKSTLFGLGLLFFPYVFYMILGFDNSTYQGTHNTSDVLFKN